MGTPCQQLCHFRTGAACDASLAESTVYRSRRATRIPWSGSRRTSKGSWLYICQADDSLLRIVRLTSGQLLHASRSATSGTVARIYMRDTRFISTGNHAMAAGRPLFQQNWKAPRRATSQTQRDLAFRHTLEGFRPGERLGRRSEGGKR